MPIDDFDRITKYLDIVPARLATEQEAANDPRAFDKYYSLVKSRAIQKIPRRLILPAHSIANGTFDHVRLVFQYNIAFDSDFYLLPFLTSNVVNGVLTVKYRLADKVTRYVIAGSMLDEDDIDRLWFDQYEGQRIRANCCFEFWFIDEFAGTTHSGLLEALNLQITQLVNPAYPEEQTRDSSQNDPFDIADLGAPAPLVNPFNQDNLVWESNPV